MQINISKRFLFRKFLFAFALLVFWALPNYGRALTLNEYLERVKKSNPSILAMQARTDSVRARANASGSLQDPFFAVGFEEIPMGETKAGMRRYQISQTIPFPGKLAASTRVAESQAESTKYDTDTIVREHVVLATQIYYRLYFSKNEALLNEQTADFLKSTLESAKSGYKTGGADHHNMLLANIELSNLEVEKLKLSRATRSLEAIFNELQNEDPSKAVPELSVEFSKESDINSSPIQSQPEISSLLATASTAEAKLKQARLSYYPDFVIQGMLMQPTGSMKGGSNDAMVEDSMNEDPVVATSAVEDPKTTWGIMIGVNLPIYFWKSQANLVSAARHELDAANLQIKSLENKLKREQIDAAQELQSLLDVVSLYVKSVLPATELATNNAKSAYINKRLPVSEYINVLQIKKIQELELLAARIDVELVKLRIREPLSSPPILRLGPVKPSLFGGSSMTPSSMSGMGPSRSINMGAGMSTPKQNSGDMNSPVDTGSGSSMEGM